MKAFIQENVQPWLSDPVVISAVKEQNAAHASLTQSDIDAMDKDWRAGVDGGDHKLINEVLGNKVSQFLKQKQKDSAGMITEIILMDDKGLNVGQNDLTSDYWQGDEAKFQKSYGAGAGAVFVDAPEKDESTQMLQSQASLTIVDESGKPIGAITIGVNLSEI
ncbi:hypothetical protein CSC94_17785 [Zhengella mangrovi]|uniref:Cache domain-containing protein n=1 Tax=Zhengella mangrovi TaxID=1982044 RepID=A0A2G1QKM7_9HYPH|nr:hypothetical protein CSC94_17785 [Zhengella mangrovi]